MTPAGANIKPRDVPGFLNAFVVAQLSLAAEICLDRNYIAIEIMRQQTCLRDLLEILVVGDVEPMDMEPTDERAGKPTYVGYTARPALGQIPSASLPMHTRACTHT